MNEQVVTKTIKEAIRHVQTEPGEWVNIALLSASLKSVKGKKKLKHFLSEFSDFVELMSEDNRVLARIAGDSHENHRPAQNNADHLSEYSEIIEALEDDILRLVDIENGEIVHKACTFLVKQLLQANRYTVECIDLGYDTSFYPVSTGHKIEINHSDSVSDLLNEPTGNSIPTFISGSGMACETFRDMLHDELHDIITTTVIDTFPILDSAYSDEEKMDILNEALHGMEVDAIEVEDLLCKIKVCDLVERYYFKARRKLEMKVRERDEADKKKRHENSQKIVELEEESSNVYPYVKRIVLFAMKQNNICSFTKGTLCILKNQLAADGKSISCTSIQAALTLIFAREGVPCSNSIRDMFKL